MSNSSLVKYTQLSPNHSGKRKYPLTRITIHCIVGQASMKSLCTLLMNYYSSSFAPLFSNFSNLSIILSCVSAIA